MLWDYGLGIVWLLPNRSCPKTLGPWNRVAKCKWNARVLFAQFISKGMALICWTSLIVGGPLVAIGQDMSWLAQMKGGTNIVLSVHDVGRRNGRLWLPCHCPTPPKRSETLAGKMPGLIIFHVALHFQTATAIAVSAVQTLEVPAADAVPWELCHHWIQLSVGGPWTTAKAGRWHTMCHNYNLKIHVFGCAIVTHSMHHHNIWQCS